MRKTDMSYAHIKKLKRKLAARQKTFQKQLKEVEKQYPLVALSYSIQRAVIAELAYTAAELQSSPALEALTGETIVQPPPLRDCFRQLDRCVGRARDDASTAGCFDTLSSCLRRKRQ